jgi:hypothetical protein
MVLRSLLPQGLKLQYHDYNPKKRMLKGTSVRERSFLLISELFLKTKTGYRAPILTSMEGPCSKVEVRLRYPLLLNIRAFERNLTF